jgi:hypothetical protein
MLNILKRIPFLAFLLVPSFAQAEEIQPEFFLHDFYNTTILFIGMDNGCGTVDQDLYQFIVKNAADHLMDEQDWDLGEAKSFLKAAAIQIHQATTAYIVQYGCDRFNFIVIENKDDYKILKDAFEIYSFEEPVDKSQITPL